jgi:ATP-dependent helicase HepA
MVGLLVRHEQYGEGRVIAKEPGGLRVRFFAQNGNPLIQEFGPDALRRGFLKRLNLETGRVCRGPDGPCIVKQLLNASPGALQGYEIEYENGVSNITSEAELEPQAKSHNNKPAYRLAERDLDNLAWFGCRESLRIAQLQNLRQGGHLVALLSARVDLYPHQAFVAGTVLDDRRRRYILGDEVGLGKTVEAGVIIHDLLLANPNARVLIICPGSLTQQWLCEIYSKFGGQVFTLPELHADSDINWPSYSRAILSMSQVLDSTAIHVADFPWDLVVVDECHHLLSAPSLYAFVKDLAQRVPSLLLLSAIPAQRRGHEFLRLLSLLEPDRFDPDRVESVEQFNTLYGAQSQLSRRLQPLVIRVRGVQTGEYTSDDVVRQSQRLLDLPLLANDTKLAKIRVGLDGPPDKAITAAIKIMDYVADRYRVYRRVLRNRRQTLVRDGKLQRVDRLREITNYRPGLLETNAISAVDDLLSQAQMDGRDPSILAILARLVWQSLASSECALDLLSPLLELSPGQINPKGRDFLALGHLTGYDDWPLYKELLQRAAVGLIRRDLLVDAVAALRSWSDSPEANTRLTHLVQVLRSRSDATTPLKILVFAGYPGLAEETAAALTQTLGGEAITEFRAEMSRESKESSAQRFERDPRVRVLVSDETGGEGRNFQFADAVVHFDQPWQLARVEQRIGRLDRIGRTRYRKDVLSLVICAAATIEEALGRCYDQGFNVYRESISGLEFSLREQEQRMIEMALTSGVEGLDSCLPDLRQAAVDERASDENDALLDWASFQESRAQRYLNVHTKPEVERYLESAFVSYFREIAVRKAATPISDDKSKEGLWKFDPDAVRIGHILPPDLSGKVVGTFRRDIAQSRLDREFFQIGNPLFDAVTHASLFHPFGRTYAVQCKSPNSPPWCGFEFVFSSQPDLSVLDNRRDLIQLVSAYFWMSPVHVFVQVDGTIEEDSQKLRVIRQSLTRETKDRVWVNLWKERKSVLDAILPGPEWMEKVHEFNSLAEASARKLLSERFQQIVSESRKRWETLAQQSREKATPNSLQEAQTLELIMLSTDRWTIYQEGAGFLAINQNLAGAQ